MPMLFDYTKNWVETDTRNEVTRTAQDIVLAVTQNLAVNTNYGRVTRSVEAPYLAGDWEFTGKISFDAGSANGFRVSPLLMAESADGQVTVAIGTSAWAQGFHMLNSSGTLYVGIYAYYPDASGGNEAATMAQNPVAGTTYYWRFRRDESVGTYGTLYLDFYTDEAMTTLFGSTSLALKYAKRDFTYLHAANGYAAVANGKGTARIGNLRDHRGYFALALGEDAGVRWSPRQHALWYDGLYFHTAGHSSNGSAPSLQYLDTEGQAFGPSHDAPSNPGSGTAKDFDLFFNFTPGYADTLWGGAGYATTVAKNDLGLASYAQRAQQAITSLSNISALIDDDERGWIAGRATTGGDLLALRGTGVYSESAYSTSLTVEATSATNACAQLVGYENGDVGLLCGIDGALTYRHWTHATETWGDTEAILSDLGVYDGFRGVVSRNGVLTVQYRRAGASGLLAKRRTAGAFGSEFTIASDITGAATDYYHASCADVGKSDVVYAFYSDGTDLKYRVITAGTVGAAQTIVVGARLMDSGLTAPPFDGHRIPLAYRHSSGAVFLEWVDVTPSQSYGGTGTAIDFNALHNTAATQVVTDGTTSLVFQQARGNYARARMRNETSGEWIGEWVTFSKRYWDQHDTMVAFKDAAGKLYFFEGGRDHGSADRNTALTLRRTAAALSTYASAAAAYADLSDISPPTTGYWSVSSGNRGYKQIVVGNETPGVIYCLFQHYEIATNTNRHLIAEYRGGAWSTPVVLVQYVGSAGTPRPLGAIYSFGYCDGGEAAPTQTSIHIAWQVRDETTSMTGGSSLIVEANYAKIVPQGAGAFKAYRIDGTEMTLPMGIEPQSKDLIYSGRPASATLAPPAWAATTAYAEHAVINAGNGHLYRCSVAGTSGGSAPTWPTNHLATVAGDGGVTWEEHGLCGAYYANTSTANGISPTTGRFVMAMGLRNFVQGDGPACTMTEHRLWKWSGTAWSWSTIQDTAMPWTCLASLAVSGSVLFVPFKKVVSGVEEVVLYSSSDEAAWGMEQVSSSSSDNNGTPTISPRTAGTITLGWAMRVHRNYGEGIFKALALAPVYFWLKARRGTGPWSALSNRVKVRRA